MFVIDPNTDNLVIKYDNKYYTGITENDVGSFLKNRNQDFTFGTLIRFLNEDIVIMNNNNTNYIIIKDNTCQVFIYEIPKEIKEEEIMNVYFYGKKCRKSILFIYTTKGIYKTSFTWNYKWKLYYKYNNYIKSFNNIILFDNKCLVILGPGEYKSNYVLPYKNKIRNRIFYTEYSYISKHYNYLSKQVKDIIYGGILFTNDSQAIVKKNKIIYNVDVKIKQNNEMIYIDDKIFQYIGYKYIYLDLTTGNFYKKYILKKERYIKINLDNYILPILANKKINIKSARNLKFK